MADVPLERSRDLSQPLEKLNPAETVKARSDFLRGTIARELTTPLTGAISGDDIQILKFHGIYQQDDRDLRDERRRQKLEPAYEFMVRVRLPGGVCQPWQWLRLDELARRHGSGSLRLTSRQTFQFHGIVKRRLKESIQAINQALLDTIGACGDDNRGVVCSPRPSPIQGQLYGLSRTLSEQFLPHTRAYHEIWLDEAGGKAVEEEPFYGPTYLPRKFKIALVEPPINDVDIYAQDLGFIAIVEGDALAGFNVSVGGGMGRTDHDPATYPRLADVIGFCRPGQVTAVARQVVAIQRDYGDRVERKHARFKYTLDDRGLPWFQEELAARLGWQLEAPRPFSFVSNGDAYGWATAADGSASFTLFVENGRVAGEVMDGLRAVADLQVGELRITPNQNVIIAAIPPAERPRLEALLAHHGLDRLPGALRRQAMACVALPTCGLAMAESERYLPGLISRLESLLAACGLGEEPITVRMSGCPNGCSRPYIAEIGLSGRAPGKYNLYLGGGRHGQRLNCLYLENVGEEKILAALEPIFRRYAGERLAGEPFGDFAIRAGYVREIRAGKEFNG